MDSSRKFAALLLLAAAACDSPTAPPAITVTVADSAHHVMVGASIPLTATVANAANAAVTWRSAAPGIAVVTATGVVTGVAPGSTVVTAVSVQDTTKRAEVSVVVLAKLVPPLPLIGHGQVSNRYTGEVAVRGDWAYTSTWGNRIGTPGNAVNVWNVNGTAPTLVSTLIVPGAGTTGDVQISDDGALLVVAVEPSQTPIGAIMIYDRSDPSSPDSLARFASANTRQGVHTVKLGRVAGRHYAFLSVNPGINPPQLVVVDITDPATPVEVLALPMGNPFLHDVFVRDGLLFTAEWDSGLGIWDIGGGTRGGTPAAPVLIGRITSNNIHNIWWFHDPAGSKRYVFLGEEIPRGVPVGSAGDLHVIDITDMANPVQVAQYHVPGAGAHNFSMDEASGVLYAAFYNGGVRALDVRGDLGSCDAAARNERGFCDLTKMGRELAVGLEPGAFTWGVVHQGTRVYASDMVAGLHIFDASALAR